MALKAEKQQTGQEDGEVIFLWTYTVPFQWNWQGFRRLSQAHSRGLPGIPYTLVKTTPRSIILHLTERLEIRR